jgi:hypothetical protein
MVTAIGGDFQWKAISKNKVFATCEKRFVQARAVHFMQLIARAVDHERADRSRLQEVIVNNQHHHSQPIVIKPEGTFAVQSHLGKRASLTGVDDGA